MKLNRTSFNTSYKKNVQLKATVSPSYAENKSMKWFTSNSKIATVTSGGYVKTTGRYGSCYIYAKAADGSGKYSRCKVTTFKNRVKSLKISKSKVTISKKGRTYKLKASVKGKNSSYRASNTGIKWKSSNKKIATVSSSGKVKAKRYGKCYIYAYAKDNKKIKKRCKVTVKTVKLKKMSASAYVEFTNFSNFKKGLIGSKKKISVKLNPSSPTDNKVYYKSSNKKVATVNSKGTVTAKGYGMCNITVTTRAKVKGKKIKKTVPVYVNGGKYYYVNGWKMSIVLNEVNKRRKAKGYSPLVWTNSSYENKRVRSWTNRFYSWTDNKFYKMGEKDLRNVHDDNWIDKHISGQQFSESVGTIGSKNSYKTQKQRDSRLKSSTNRIIVHDNKIVTNKNIKYFVAWHCNGKYYNFSNIRSY
ncbi:Ig-like domain-containing protein [Anaerofustis stercorihominis]|uniref:Ig-like domain-containing protein n=1 Tax=Anaerofustis stercorihominis TaxID=214853 RepID=UPI00210CCFBC|nr:Ig-like domain-containing protein [Anaerofustis stercorihominis]